MPLRIAGLSKHTTAPGVGSKEGQDAAHEDCGPVAPTPDVVRNQITGNQVRTAVEGRFPGLEYAGMCCCRHCRDCATCPPKEGCYSTHSVCGAVDYGPGNSGHSLKEVEAFALTLPQIRQIDYHSSASIHLQYVDDLSSAPPCLGGTDTGGGTTVVPPPGAIMAATALKAAKCPAPAAVNMVGIAYRESRWNPTAHTFGQGCGPGECGRHNGPGTVCEDSFGLWQINWCAHGETLEAKGITRTMLLFASTNAKAAGIISGGFKSLDPWRGTQGVSEETMAQAKAAVDAVYLGIGVDDQCAKLWADWIKKGSKGPAPDCSFSVEGDPTSAIPDAFGWVGDLVGKFIAALGIGLAAGVILFGAYLIVRSSQGRTVREVGTSLASPFRALGGRSRGRASSGPRRPDAPRTTRVNAPTISQQAQERRIDQGLRDTAETVVENTRREGRGSGPRIREGVGR